MKWTSQHITPTELTLLRALWKEGPSTIRDLTDQLYPEGGHSHYATVQSLLDRLEAKACVQRKKQGRLNIFTAVVSKSQLLKRRMRELAEQFCDGSMAPLLSNLVDPKELNPGELDALHTLVERLDRSSQDSEQQEDE